MEMLSDSKPAIGLMYQGKVARKKKSVTSLSPSCSSLVRTFLSERSSGLSVICGRLVANVPAPMINTHLARDLLDSGWVGAVCSTIGRSYLITMFRPST
jgi:hypothetical protein